MAIHSSPSFSHASLSATRVAFCASSIQAFDWRRYLKIVVVHEHQIRHGRRCQEKAAGAALERRPRPRRDSPHDRRGTSGLAQARRREPAAIMYNWSKYSLRIRPGSGKISSARLFSRLRRTASASEPAPELLEAVCYFLSQACGTVIARLSATGISALSLRINAAGTFISSPAAFYVETRGTIASLKLMNGLGSAGAEAVGVCSGFRGLLGHRSEDPARQIATCSQLSQREILPSAYAPGVPPQQPSKSRTGRTGFMR